MKTMTMMKMRATRKSGFRNIQPRTQTSTNLLAHRICRGIFIISLGMKMMKSSIMVILNSIYKLAQL